MFEKEDTVFGHKCVIYKIKPQEKLEGYLIRGIGLGAHAIHYYWFSPELGIIKRGYSVRSDILPVDNYKDIDCKGIK